MRLIFLLSILFLILPTKKTKDDNDYFYGISKEIAPIRFEPKKIAALETREFEKYKATNDEKYLISSKYIKLFLYSPENTLNNIESIKQAPSTYELLKLNNDRYEYISIACNFNMTFYCEHNSPKLAMKFLDNAIRINEKLGKKYFLPHLYHIKGRLYFNEKNYPKAMFYFNKALQTYKKEDLLYIASMYNNFGLVQDKLNQIIPAMQETQKGIRILEGKNHYNEQEIAFLNYMRSTLGSYYYKLKEFSSAEKLFLQQFEFTKNKPLYYSQNVACAKSLFYLYSDTKETNKQKLLINYLVHIEPKLKTIHDKILTNEIIQQYYSNQNDLLNLKLISAKLVHLNHDFVSENDRISKQISAVLNNYAIENINQKTEQQINIQKRKTIILLISVLALILIFIVILIFVKIRHRNKKGIIEKEKLLLEKDKKILEQDIVFQNEKIKNLHQNLHLKTETEKVFLENLKKIKKTNNTGGEEIIKDLFLNINNLIQINKRNIIISESNIEYQRFMKKISDTYPLLTNKELKMCVYFRMNLSSKEISSLENTTTGTIRVYKTKIKTKMNLDRETKLDDFLNSIQFDSL
jgi:tetratricopeptide (TPR) repeat protein/DNA-binding CsgD family transcriptional regulator